MRGRFLVLEGIDGCGKTTQLNHLTRWLPESGLMPKGAELHVTREPGGTNLGEAIRKLLLTPPANQAPDPLTELLLYAADRAQHISEYIQPRLETGDWVLSDRFSGSTLAYQGYGRKLNFEVINQLESIATKDIIPDITFWLDVPIKESLARRKSKFKDRIESEGINFLTEVALGFNAIADQRNWIKISGNLTVHRVSKILEVELIKYFNKNNPIPE